MGNCCGSAAGTRAEPERRPYNPRRFSTISPDASPAKRVDDEEHVRVVKEGALGLTWGTGTVIDGVLDGSAAARASLDKYAGWSVVAINGTPVASTSAVDGMWMTCPSGRTLHLSLKPTSTSTPRDPSRLAAPSGLDDDSTSAANSVKPHIPRLRIPPKPKTGGPAFIPRKGCDSSSGSDFDDIDRSNSSSSSSLELVSGESSPDTDSISIHSAEEQPKEKRRRKKAGMGKGSKETSKANGSKGGELAARHMRERTANQRRESKPSQSRTRTVAAEARLKASTVKAGRGLPHPNGGLGRSSLTRPSRGTPRMNTPLSRTLK